MYISAKNYTTQMFFFNLITSSFNANCFLLIYIIFFSNIAITPTSRENTLELLRVEEPTRKLKRKEQEKKP